MRITRWIQPLFFPLGLLAAPPVIHFDLQRLPVILENHPTQRKYLPETMAGGVAAFDYDGDGRIDLFFTNGAPLSSLTKEAGRDDNRLFHNEGNFRFRDVTRESGLAGEGYSIGAAVADYDNDGRPDLFVAGVNGGHLYHNDGRGHFTDVTVRAGVASHDWSVAAAWFDYDRDGLPDLFVVNYVKWSRESNPFCTETARAIPVYCHPDKFAGLPNRLFHNLGNGKFEDVSEKSGIARFTSRGMSASVIDYDGDGFPDIFVTNDTGPNFLFHNLGNGRFEEVALSAGVALPDNGRAVSGMGTDARDYDNDGRPDIIFSALTGETFPLFHNLGRGSFEDASYSTGLAPLTIRRSGWGIVFADLDNDGWKDVVSANSHVTDNIGVFSGDRYVLPNSIFRNRGNGTFEDVSATAGEAFGVARAHRGLVAADLDGDGRLDLVVTVLGDSPEIWHNTTPGAYHWIEFRLHGRTGNRDALGAQIRVAGQTNVQSSSSGYASSTLAPVHFGLGTLEKIPGVEIVWPDGRTQKLTDVAPDRVVDVQEP
ncbi:MAG TPA: CRTAC1 family protein [Bryobacteraceae bacterium]|nr:CRTAC1 family protein [Bryobacteraceae bacterium]